ncbi:hypothetical protein [Deinococcus depolymerans]|uniref:Uncharacterized protein n=1 Tax=Deinococcus depolymerans TaxID=392408 RepID=A0ABP3LTY5_9DEIO
MLPSIRAAGCFALLTIGAGLPGPASAQSAAPLQGLTDAELDLLLSATDLLDPNGFLPGVIAPDLPFRVAPFMNRTVVGSVIQPFSTKVVVRTTLNPETASAIAEGLLRRDGWLDMYPTNPTMEVFQDAPGSTTRGAPLLCKPGLGGQMNINVFPNGSGLTQVNYSFQAFGAACPSGRARTTPNAYESVYENAVDPLQTLLSSGVTLPVLSAPAEALIEPSGNEYSGSYYKTYAKVFSSLSAEQVRAAYVGRLNAQDWATTSSTRKGSELISTVRRTFGKRTLTATFALTPRPGQTRMNGTKSLQQYDVKFEFTY